MYTIKWMVKNIEFIQMSFRHPIRDVSRWQSPLTIKYTSTGTRFYKRERERERERSFYTNHVKIAWEDKKVLFSYRKKRDIERNLVSKLKIVGGYVYTRHIWQYIIICIMFYNVMFIINSNFHVEKPSETCSFHYFWLNNKLDTHITLYSLLIFI